MELANNYLVLARGLLTIRPSYPCRLHDPFAEVQSEAGPAVEGIDLEEAVRERPNVWVKSCLLYTSPSPRD